MQTKYISTRHRGSSTYNKLVAVPAVICKTPTLHALMAEIPEAIIADQVEALMALPLNTTFSKVISSLLISFEPT